MSETPQSAAEQFRQDDRVNNAFRSYHNNRVIEGENGAPRQPKNHGDVLPFWEDMWGTFDFSWNGLSDAGWNREVRPNHAEELKRWRAPHDFPGLGKEQGAGKALWKEATLQDYWRWSIGITDDPYPGRLLSDDELLARGLLVEQDGKLYHQLHLPGSDVAIPPDDTVGSTSAREALARLVLSRLTLSCDQKTDTAFELAFRGDGMRASGIDGLILKCAREDENRIVHLSLSLSELTEFSVKGTRFGDGCRFWGTIFGASANFDETVFGDDADFQYATFGNGPRFERARFGNGAKFVAGSFGREPWFHEARFGDSASFSSATLGRQGNFWKTEFGKGARFSSAHFGDSYSVFGQGGFHQARFADNAAFDRINTVGTISFSAARFGDAPTFQQARFGDYATFSQARFGDLSSFSHVDFRGPAEFDNVRFAGRTSFFNAQWDPGTHYGGTFAGATFEDVTDFRTPNFVQFSAFHHAVFKQPVLLQPPTGGVRPEDIFRNAQDIAKAAIQKKIHFEKTRVRDPEEEDSQSAIQFSAREIKDRIWSELSGGYRVAKKLMETAGDFDREQAFYRFEVKSRMRRPGISWPERVASWFYRIFSDYGASIGRPFAGLLLFTPLFAAIYFSIAAITLEGVTTPEPSAPDEAQIEMPLQALEFSLNNAFRPLSALATQEPVEGAAISPPDKRLGERLLFDAGTAWGIGVRILAIIQSLLSFILAFLFGLAVRRKFQIN